MKTASNSVIVFGRAAQDPSFFAAKEEGNSSVAFLNLAVNGARNKDGNRRVDFLNTKIFGKGAEVFQEHVKKGQGLLIEGRLQSEQREIEGKKISQMVIVIENFEFINTAPKKDAGANAADETSAVLKEPETEEFINIPEGIDDEIPFI